MQVSLHRDAEALGLVFHLLGYVAARRDLAFSSLVYVDDFNLLNFLIN